ncbi:HNH endonuclease [Methylibium petroleiphilum]|uniref:HNH nuclease domain-containing protein n=1 Tax=Methylibium petroleiphilum (strain ATCC BAA-1232 / LMG 22953 / PM1) TaxID=420662 RepID=A2SMM5_METPP|nr:HNH endonuclease signature motif containing protein [Methylibium petroleiphilum]ABM96814.1 hypothetical protein Mpe_B0033 [Methylibium petroleiphilum PM1]
MPTRERLEGLLPIGSQVLSGGNRTSFRIVKYNQRGVQIASTSSRKTALLRYAKLDLVLNNFHLVDPERIQDSIMELMKQHGVRWTQNETFLYGLAREHRTRTAMPDLLELHAEFERQVNECAQMSSAERRNMFETGQAKPERVIVQTTVFMRNPAVAAEVLLRANGHCELCRQSAPFKRRKDGTPYLEVHHRKPLSDGGNDTVQNAIALCPNCHRRAHYA